MMTRPIEFHLFGPMWQAECDRCGDLSLFGPMWQAECDRCGDLSNVFDNNADRDRWCRKHECRETEQGLRQTIEFLERENENLRRELEQLCRERPAV